MTTKTCPKNLPEKRARSILDDSYTLLALFELQKDPRDPQGPGPKGSPGARAQGIPRGPGPRVPLGPGPRDPQGPGPKGSPGTRAQGIPWGPGPRDPLGPGPKGSLGAHRLKHGGEKSFALNISLQNISGDPKINPVPVHAVSGS